MQRRVIDASPAPIVRVGGRPAGGWLGARPPSQLRRDRTAKTVDSAFGLAGGVRAPGRPARLLTPAQRRLIYERTPDVRAAVDQIARRVATWEWIVEAADGIEPGDEEYDEALEIARAAARWLHAPNEDGETWQEWVTKVVTDLLIHDAGVSEIVYNRLGTLAELVAVNGGTMVPKTDRYGRTLHYVQDLFGGMGEVPDDAPRLDPDQVLYLKLFPNTEGARGMPIIESIVTEVITVLRASEHAMHAFDADEIPPGLLVLYGIKRTAAKRAKSDLERMRGKDHKIRVITSTSRTGSVGAEWVELRRTPKDLSMESIVESMRRVIWREFGVAPVEMGSEESNRAHAVAQLDVSNSHLIEPILEILQAKLNARILPLVVADEDATDEENARRASLIRFAFDRDARLSPEQELDLARALGEHVDRGVLSRNEGRDRLGQHPVAGGDVHTVQLGNQLVRISDLDLEGGGEAPDDGQGPGAADPGDDEEGPGEVQAGEDARPRPGARRSPQCRLEGESFDDCVSRKVPEILEKDPGVSREQAVAIASSMCEEDCEDQASARSWRQPGEPRCPCGSRAAGDLPSDWQPGSRFDDVRTLDLVALGDEIGAYRRAVEPLWREARDEVVGAIASAADGGLGQDEAKRVRERAMAALDRLLTRWAVATGPRYRKAAKIGRDAAADFTGTDALDDWERRAERFHDRAMGYLSDPEGLVREVRTTVLQAIVRAGPSARSMHARQEDEEERVLRAAEEADHTFRSNEHRIDNWSGRLVQLSSDTAVAGLAAASTVAAEEGSGEARPEEDEDEAFEPQDREAGEWFAEWVAVGDSVMCPTCEAEGAAGFRPVSQLTTVPGGDTECRARCRCVLVYWTRSEVDSGEAVSLSGA